MFEKASEELKKVGQKFTFEFIRCDLSRKEERERVWKQILDKHNRVHLLVNNAALARLRLFKEISFE